ncbi:MAG: hypothetical protein WC316_00770, partial [Candidatus Omnitrophota bacterium]
HDLAAVLAAHIEGKDIDLVGPAPEFISKIKGQYRWSMFLKGSKPRDMCGYIDKALEGLAGKSAVTIAVDVDPLGL